jgi:hypothetical protein
MRARKPSDNKRELVKRHLTLPFGLTPSGSRQEVTKEYGSSWIFEPCLTWASALRRVQHPGFSW